MSFPLSAPPSEPQSRGHFYWALKGTLSLGFNTDLPLIYRWKAGTGTGVPSQNTIGMQSEKFPLAGVCSTTV